MLTARLIGVASGSRERSRAKLWLLLLVRGLKKQEPITQTRLGDRGEAVDYDWVDFRFYR